MASMIIRQLGPEVPGVAEVLKREIAKQLQKCTATTRLEEHLHTHKHTYTQTLLYNM